MFDKKKFCQKFLIRKIVKKVYGVEEFLIIFLDKFFVKKKLR